MLLRTPKTKTALALTGTLIIGIAMGGVISKGLAQMAAPSEHKGLSVDQLGIITEESIEAQTGLSGYFMQLRAITIEPGGQIAKHSHESRPGLVKVVSGSWTEGRPEGETTVGADDEQAILEDRDTVHWFWNRGDDSATAIVCDLTPSS